MDDSERQEELLKEGAFKKGHLKEEQVMVMALGMKEEGCDDDVGDGDVVAGDGGGGGGGGRV